MHERIFLHHKQLQQAAWLSLYIRIESACLIQNGVVYVGSGLGSFESDVMEHSFFITSASLGSTLVSVEMKQSTCA